MMRRSRLFLCAVERMKEEFDIVIVGGGPSGLSAAIRAKQLKEDLRVAIVEKGSMIGAHSLSGACFEPTALNELLPEWKSMEGCPITQKVHDDNMYLLSKKGQIKVPWLPPTLHNHNNYIISQGAMCKWLSEHAEGLGVEIYPGFAAADIHYGDDANDKSSVKGVILNDTGIDKKGEKKADYQPGMIFEAKQTIFAEGCRGSCTKKLEAQFGLRKKEHNFQSFALGVKEVWEVPKEMHHPGKIVHTTGWPLTKGEGHDNTYGGSFLYHYGDGLISLGFVVGLDYSNPYTRPYMELQKWKTHPLIAPMLAGGKPISYGARTLCEGGFQAVPDKLSFPGGLLVGDCAGFLNLPKIKGNHTAMKSGMLAAEAVIEDVLSKGGEHGKEATSYRKRYENSWVHKELKQVRNCRPAFAKNFYYGMLYTGAATVINGIEPWTLQHHHKDHETLKPISQSKAIEYPKPDGKLTFDLLTNHSRSGTSHNADQPAHLKVLDRQKAKDVNLDIYGGPEGKYCPAQVYEWVEKDGKKELVINAQNCLHCKACDIKDPTQNINWTVPEGGGGPNYNAAM
eukprot:GILI01009469.1.p1 GENE.GILI01009469.1~~GILI01009469.1.p1  ORF type:complete len:566 (-),score=146.67 GILI01009469.1:184-1881(-)